MKNKPELGKYGYSGSCAPRYDARFCGSQETFSVGIFKWQQGKKGLVKGKVQVRVGGRKNKAFAIYDKAEEICRQLDSGTYLGAKNVRIK